MTDERSRLPELRSLLLSLGRNYGGVTEFVEVDHPGVPVVVRRIKLDDRALARIGKPQLVEVVIRPAEAETADEGVRELRRRLS